MITIIQQTVFATFAALTSSYLGIQLSPKPLGQDSRNVACETATGYVGHGLDELGTNESDEGLDVDDSRLKQGLT
jgi:hypothetical protein